MSQYEHNYPGASLCAKIMDMQNTLFSRLCCHGFLSLELANPIAGCHVTNESMRSQFAKGPFNAVGIGEQRATTDSEVLSGNVKLAPRSQMRCHNANFDVFSEC